MASGGMKWVAGFTSAAIATLSALSQAHAEPQVKPCLAFGVLDPWQKSGARTLLASDCAVHFLTTSKASGGAASSGASNFVLTEVVDPWAPRSRRLEPSGTWLAAKVSGLDIVDPWSHLPGRPILLPRAGVLDPWRSVANTPLLPASGL